MPFEFLSGCIILKIYIFIHGVKGLLEVGWPLGVSLVLSSATITIREFLILNIYTLLCVYFGRTERTIGNVRIFSAVRS